MARLPFEKEALSEVPTRCGVYVFYDERGKPLYVGKATDLRSRMRSYFAERKERRLVTLALAGRATEMDYLVTRSTKEALLLENSLIKKHRPRLNIRLTDDKTYFSLEYDPKEEWPRLRVRRRRQRKDVIWFGPYPSARACRLTIRFLSSIFPLRTCPDHVLYNRTRPCMLHEIGRCVAPCVGLVEKGAYEELAEQMIRFLRGQDTEVIARLERERDEAAAALRFEKAAEIRDRLAHIRTTLQGTQVARRSGPDRDVVGIWEGAEERVGVCVLHVRDGMLTASASYDLKRLQDVEELLSTFLGQFYGPQRPPPAEVLLPAECADLALHEEILAEIRGTRVKVEVPIRGEGVRLLRLAEENAELALKQKARVRAEDHEVLLRLAERLGLEGPPQSIEGYDVSHLAGEAVVASGVCFRDGKPSKEDYRHYRLRDVQRNDDFAAMEEILRRRFRRAQKDHDLPDLILIDGGRPQLRRVMEVFEEFGVDGVAVIGLAKARRGRTPATAQERVVLPDRDDPILLDEDTPEKRLLQRIRDEAHRFAITHNRKLRAKTRIGSVLETIPGVGPRRARALLQTLGSLEAVKRSSLEQLRAVPGLPDALAEAVHAHFHGAGGAGPGAPSASTGSSRTPSEGV